MNRIASGTSLPRSATVETSRVHAKLGITKLSQNIGALGIKGPIYNGKLADNSWPLDWPQVETSPIFEIRL